MLSVLEVKMSETTLHITNGGSLTDYLKELDIKGDILTWHENAL